MSNIRYKMKKVNISVYFSSPYDSKLVSLFKSKKESHGFKWIPETKEWEISYRIGEFRPLKDDLNTYTEILSFFPEDQKLKFVSFFQAKNKTYYDELSKKEEESQERLKKYFDRIKEYNGLYEHQIDDIKTMSKSDSIILANEMGTGKALWEYSKVLTPNGWIYIKDLQINDDIINSDGLVSKVVGVFPQGIKELYKITFSDNSNVICCDEHLWNVQSTNHRYRNSPYRTKITNELRKTPLQYKNGNNKWYIPTIKPIQNFNNNYKFIIDPYIMGCLLGDGHFHKKYITFSSADIDIIKHIKELCPNEITLSKNKTSKYDYLFINKTKNTINIFNREIIKLGLYNKLSNSKFIPTEYKLSNIQDRIKLLQGLMDTDGWSLKRDHNLQYGTTSEKLKDDVIFLINSLGGTVTVSIKKPKYTYKDIIKNGLLFYILTIKLPDDITPFTLKRKLITRKRKVKYVPYKAIKSIEYYKKDNAVCISTNSKDELFITDGFNLTHNTRTAIVYSEIQDFEKVLIICPASLKLNWKKELKMINPSATICVLPKDTYNMFTKYYIINYDMLIKQFEFKEHEALKNRVTLEIKEDSFLSKVKFDCMLIDEAQYIKNDSKRTKVVLYLTNTAKFTVPISGTPVKSKTRDLFNLLVAVKHPITYDGFFNFGVKYCAGEQTKYGWDFNGSSNQEELHQKLKPFMIRRLKEDCLDLPPKIITEVYTELSADDKKLYDDAFDNYISYVSHENRKKHDVITANLLTKNVEYAEHLVKLNLLKQVCANSKLPMVFERIQDLLDEDENRKIIIFSQYIDVISKVFSKFKKVAVKLTGSVSMEQRQKAVDDFQTNPDVRLFIGQTLAGGVGITLTKADTVIFVDLLWTPSDHVQAEDRAHRIGQHASVNVLYFITQDTIEEDIFELIQSKKKNIDKIVDNKDSENMSNNSIFKDVVRRINNKLLL